MTAVSTHPLNRTADTVAMRSPVAEVASLTKSIDGRLVLDRIDLSFDAGSAVALLGANGAGKSTLLRILCGLLPPTSGEVKLFGQRLSAGSQDLRARLGLIGHQALVYRDLSALENLSFFARLYGVRDAAGRASRMLEMVGLADRRNDPARSFSRGMLQRLAVARALVHDPDLLLADEPFDGLDAPSAEALESLLAQLRAAGKTIILVNHDIEQALRVSQRVIVLRDGHVGIDAPVRGLTAGVVRAEVR